MARRKAQRSNSENAVVDNGEKGEEEIVRDPESAEIPKSPPERRRGREKRRRQRTPKDAGSEWAICLAKARREEADSWH